MKRYYVLAAVCLMLMLASGFQFYRYFDNRFRKGETRIQEIEADQKEQAERLRIVERTNTVTEEGRTEVVDRIGRSPQAPRATARPRPRPDPVPSPVPAPSVPRPTPFLDSILKPATPEPTHKPCKDIKNDRKRRKCRKDREDHNERSARTTPAPRESDRRVPDSRDPAARR